MPAPPFFSATMVRALPEDGRRYETVHGELLVSPAPRLFHQVLVGRLHALLQEYLAREEIGCALASPADLSWAPDVLVQPDLFVVPLAEARMLDWCALRTLLLVVEVLSPGTARADRFAKRRLYQEHGVGAYWVVDADARLVEVWTPEALFPVAAEAEVTWHPRGASRPFVVEVAALLRAV